MTLTLMAKGKTVQGLEALRQFDACTLSNAIERFRVRPRNEGFISSGVGCRFPHSRPIVGHAVTGRIQTYMPPITGKCYYDHIEWWRYLLTIPPPRVVVLYDLDHRPGFGAIFGEIHARICRALDCEAFVTNGSVRDLHAIEPLGIQLFSGSVSVSHAYAHIVDFGNPIEIGGLVIKAGDILFGDRHGVISIPPDLVKALPQAVQELQSEEQELFDLTESPTFSVETLGNKLRQFAERNRCS